MSTTPLCGNQWRLSSPTRAVELYCLPIHTAVLLVWDRGIFAIYTMNNEQGLEKILQFQQALLFTVCLTNIRVVSISETLK